ncbi:MAG: Gfo/Idh/MocA family oxidoreductase [Chitinophagaceae bacterium]|nr:MAG: Gfo/Idh/MocA family oxidoreductase [Chitinophagaceae bacterium]
MYRIAVISDQALPAALVDGTATISAWCFQGMAAAPRVNTDAAPVFATVDALLAEEKKPDLVVIQTRTGYHAEYAIKAFQAGCPVLCNGPLCLTGSAAWQILETARYTGQPFQVQQADLHFWREAGAALGDVSSFHAWARGTDGSAGERFPDGGRLYTVFYPLVEALSALLGPVETVSGSLSETSPEGLETGGNARIGLPGGGTGYLDWSALASDVPPGFSIEVDGANGSLRVDGTFDGDRLSLSNVETIGFDGSDPAPGPGAEELLHRALRGELVPEWAPFPALRAVEWIDRIYSRLRQGS